MRGSLEQHQFFKISFCKWWNKEGWARITTSEGRARRYWYEHRLDFKLTFKSCEQVNLLSKAVWISSHRLPAVLSPFFKTKAQNKVRSSYSKQKDTFTNICLPGTFVLNSLLYLESSLKTNHLFWEIEYSPAASSPLRFTSCRAPFQPQHSQRGLFHKCSTLPRAVPRSNAVHYILCEGRL